MVYLNELFLKSRQKTLSIRKNKIFTELDILILPVVSEKIVHSP
jgi:hypothetical protein